MDKTLTLGKVGKGWDTFGLILLLYRTGKVGKVGDNFGLICHLFKTGKVGKVSGTVVGSLLTQKSPLLRK